MDETTRAVHVDRELLAWLRAEPGAGTATPDGITDDMLARFRALRDEFQQLRMIYRFGIDEVSTKIDILRQEFESTYDYSPIEHVRTRLKSPDSMLTKALRQGTELAVPAIRAEIRDIAGIRITCSFVSDVYWIAEMLSTQADLRLLTTKDYIAHPKPNGYRSLHLIVEVPVFLSRTVEHVTVELQIRTIAMDFWASMEHKLHYKYRAEMPPHLAAEIEDAARLAADLDDRMGRLRDEVRPSPHQHDDTPEAPRP
ncbi:putative GTP pyrophosphokinase [Isoptericola jiangsuensis]|uniref:Putative GTP pyrophosphokinase n=1 Tax=Isoptericola jiangsuensis TaxID=548579 RepID=A0A2A9ER33_9MICO|nr:GTP pyrophosphokinase family protein [Isoptericola jiangsuensis]PFG41454.1 putative GTP pyrophosphokinase [Isoptericola jiangsuensis]